MRKAGRIFLYGFIGIMLTVLIFSFWLLSRQPSNEQINKAFPSDSFKLFNDGKNITLYSLKPGGQIESKEDFHYFTVLGKTEVKSGSSRFLLKHFLVNGMVSAYGAACFNPRHGLRILDEEKTLDVVICFECGHFVTYYDNQTGEGELESFTAEALYNQMLENAEVKLNQ